MDSETKQENSAYKAKQIDIIDNKSYGTHNECAELVIGMYVKQGDRLVLHLPTS
jgi:hypothetical protein